MAKAEELKIREFRETDERLVQEFFDNFDEESVRFFNSGGGNTRFALKAVRNELQNSKFWMAEDMTESGPKMAGYVFLCNLNFCVPWLGIAVGSEWKGKGLGTILMRHAIVYCKNGGYGGITLTTVLDNYVAQHLYEKHGFERMGFSKNQKEYTYILNFSKQ